ncbi:MAG: tripartite tricarboxylate transporter substrate binding protein [Betaproteobacteria bacterium]|nr:tripartite tricarboxylate transporter substrate binding protein [Betaproteobacteria bacterium]
MRAYLKNTVRPESLDRVRNKLRRRSSLDFLLDRPVPSCVEGLEIRSGRTGAKSRPVLSFVEGGGRVQQVLLCGYRSTFWLLFWLLAFGSTLAAAQSYPTRAIRIIVPFAAGGGTDIVARTVGAKLGEGFGQTVIVDNRAGAAGAIGTELAAKSAADGYTLLLGSNGPLAISPGLHAKLPYDPLRDFAPVAHITTMPFLMVVHPSLPVRSVKDLIALAKARPGQLNYASPGSGSTTHLAAELFKAMAGVNIVHVPYKGVAPAATDLISGQVQMLSGDLNTLMPHVKSGKMRPLAVTGAARSSLLPEMQTISEAGVPGYEASGWFGILVPAGTPQELVRRLNSEIAKSLASPDLRQRLAGLGGEVAGGTPEQFAAHLRQEIAKWGKLIRTIGLKAESGA